MAGCTRLRKCTFTLHMHSIILLHDDSMCMPISFTVQALHHATAGEHCPKHLILPAVPHPPPLACGPSTALEHAHR